MCVCVCVGVGVKAQALIRDKSNLIFLFFLVRRQSETVTSPLPPPADPADPGAGSAAGSPFSPPPPCRASLLPDPAIPPSFPPASPPAPVAAESPSPAAAAAPSALSFLAFFLLFLAFPAGLSFSPRKSLYPIQPFSLYVRSGWDGTSLGRAPESLLQRDDGEERNGVRVQMMFL